MGGLGAAYGLSHLLQNLEAAAEGAKPPPRFLLMFWPLGTVPYLFRPTSAGFDYQASPILQPFEAAGLRQDMIALYGLGDRGVTVNGGGGAEGGVVLRTTGANSPGTRLNGGEGDDSVAGGPSFDQIFLRKVPELSVDGAGYVNAIGDARVDSHEISAQCLSYGYETRDIPSANPIGGTITEHVPLMPELAPAAAFARVFAGFMPGGSTEGNIQELLRALHLRKSVLDFSLGELARLQAMAPASERHKIEIHADAIRKLEQQIADQMAGGTPRECKALVAPDPERVAKSGSSFEYANPIAESDESAALAELSELHLSVIRTAFQCDALRVATFQWASSTSHVAFGGLHPGDPASAYMHHPMSHKHQAVSLESRPSEQGLADWLQFFGNVHTWLNQETAKFLLTLKNTHDAFGAPLLDNTIVPFVTDKADVSDRRSPLPTLIFGGRALGMRGGQYIDLVASGRPHNDVWLSIAQAFFPALDDVMQALGDETFARNSQGFTGPISGIWERAK